MKIIKLTFLRIGILLIIVGAIMFVYGVHMFTYLGQFSILEKDLGELSFAFWLPTLIVGIILTVISSGMKSTKRN